jgi:phosphoglucosamine mutase
VLAVDGDGRPHDGDELMALAAAHLGRRGSLEGGVVVTVMTNLGFHRAMEQAGIEVATTQVGDRHVIAELERRRWQLGGEQSGHIIATEFAPTGDGIVAALLTMQALDGANLAEAEVFERLPQRLENVRIADPGAIDAAAGLWEAVERENAALDGRGRVLVRASGTEPLLRVMVEAPSEDECAEVCKRLVSLIERELA